MKKFCITLVLGCMAFPGAGHANAETSAPRLFTVSAYYSPLPDQSLYMRGSYEEDVILNGRGTNGASGKEVFSGMLAAPKKYGFGTKIWIKGLGLGTVHDRGGAIVEEGKRGQKYDRIDVWMGSGEEGLRRALTWGMRTVEAQVIDGEMEKKLQDASSSKLETIDVSAFRALKKVKVQGGAWLAAKKKGKILSPTSLAKAKSVGKSEKTDIKKLMLAANETFGVGAIEVRLKNSTLISSAETRSLFARQALGDLGYMTGALSKDLTGALIAFQVQEKLVPSEKHKLAGIHGPKTQERLLERYADFMGKVSAYKKIAAEMENLERKRKDVLTQTGQVAYSETLKIGSLSEGAVGIRVRQLQNLLSSLGYFSDKDTAIFGKNTVQAVVAYQKEKKLIDSEKSLAAGRVGTKTLTELAKDWSLHAQENENTYLAEIASHKEQLRQFSPQHIRVAQRSNAVALR